MRNIKGKFFLSGGLMLLLMFIHLVSIIDNCNTQVTNNTNVISAFNG